MLDAYLGEIPETFTFKGKSYTARSFGEELGINPDNYTYITSYSHYPFYSQFILFTVYSTTTLRKPNAFLCMSSGADFNSDLAVLQMARYSLRRWRFLVSFSIFMAVR